MCLVDVPEGVRSFLPFGANEKTAGLMVPLFSVPSALDCGIGDILGLIPMIDWMLDQHLRVLQILPIHEMAPTETSPYKALSSFAIDPVYLSFCSRESLAQYPKNPDLEEGLFLVKFRGHLDKWRKSKEICYGPIRRAKLKCLQKAFQVFKKREWDRQTTQAEDFRNFMDRKSAWLDEYALFRLIKEQEDWRDWNLWPQSLKSRAPEVLKKIEKSEAIPLLFIKYTQWVLWTQWQKVRNYAKAVGVRLMGDLPFLPSRDSADVWCRQDEFSETLSVGAPPDNFNAQGQEWKLPLFLWDTMKRNALSWWRIRIYEARDLYDLIRLDHVVGFFRTWVIPKEGKGYFEPSEVTLQSERGTSILRAILEQAGEMLPFAEDLGLVPDFVRQTLRDLQIAGYKVLRWERSGADYQNPKNYPLRSLATTGTHDTLPLAGWWKNLPNQDRKRFLQMLGEDVELFPDLPYSMRLHQKILNHIMGAGSCLVILPIQDILVVDEQINIPGTEGPHNWRYRMPRPLSKLSQSPSTRAALGMLQESIMSHGRSRPAVWS